MQWFPKLEMQWVPRYDGCGEVARPVHILLEETLTTLRREGDKAYSDEERQELLLFLRECIAPVINQHESFVISLTYCENYRHELIKLYTEVTGLWLYHVVVRAISFFSTDDSRP
jgi:hypothetical protein